MDLRTYRKNADLTQQELAVKSGVDRTTIVNVESGHVPSGRVIKKLVEACDGLVSPEDFFKEPKT